MMSANCPICGKDDAIQKVSSVVSSSQFSGRFSGPTGGLTYSGGKVGVVGGYTALSGSSRSNLVTFLSPPEKPRNVIPFGAVGFMLFGMWFFLILGGLALIGAPLQPAWRGAAGPISGICGGIGLFLAAWVFHRLSVRERRRQQAVYFDYLKEKAIWDKEIKRWNDLYYCFRDDIAFDPKTGRNCKPAEMATLLVDEETI